MIVKISGHLLIEEYDPSGLESVQEGFELSIRHEADDWGVIIDDKIKVEVTE